MYRFKMGLGGLECRFGVIEKVILSAALVCTSSFALESEKLYKHCVVCHGEKGDRKAIKRSPQLSLLTKGELSLSLKKILDGSTPLYRNYVAMHKVKLKHLNPEDTDAFASYIVSLKK